VSPDSAEFLVSVYVKYGNEASFMMSNQQINVTGSGQPGPQTNIAASFSDGIGLAGASMSATDCTVTFTQNPYMGIAATRIWGVIDCPKVSAPNDAVASSCDGNAQFLFESCGR
jgi:hypothetical protein